MASLFSQEEYQKKVKMKMKVLHVINDFNSRSGGAELLVQRLHNGLLEHNIDSKLLGITASQESFKEALSLNVRWLYSLTSFFKLAKFLRKTEQDRLLHVHLFPAVFYVALAKKLGLIRQKILFTEHSTSNRRRDKWWGKLLDRFIYSSLSSVVAISEGTASELQSWMPSLKGRVTVILNGIDLMHRELSLAPNNEAPVMVTVGRLTEAKNHENILKALSTLMDVSFTYRIIGDGELRVRLEELTQEWGLHDKVEFLGYRSDIKAQLEKADIFVAVSKWEGFGLAALEAMNCGLAVIASNINGLKELFIDTENAALVDPKNLAEISQQLRLLLTDPSYREVIREACFNSSLNFDVNTMVNEYMTIYGELGV